MPAITLKVRERIQAQGFCDLDDDLASQINYPLRIAPALCMIWTAVGTSLSSPAILWSLVPFAVLGAILSGHPFDVIYNIGLRRLLDMPALPRYGARRRFACGLASVLLSGSAIGFQTEMPLFGNILGWSLVFAAFVNVTTGFCVPSFIFSIFFGKVACERKPQLLKYKA